VLEKWHNLRVKIPLSDTMTFRRSVQFVRVLAALSAVSAAVACGSSGEPAGPASSAGASNVSGAPSLAGGGSSSVAGSPSVAGASAAGSGAAPDSGGGGGVNVAGAPSGGTASGGTASGGTASGGTGGSAAGQGGASAGTGGTGGASTPAFDRAAVTAIMRRVADYEIARFGSDNNNDWVRAVFHTGMLAAYRALGDAKYHDYTENWGKANNWQIHTSNKGVRFADNQTCVQSYAELYQEAPTAQNAAMIAAAQTTYDTMVASPKAGRVEWYWCDALYMAPAGMVRVAKATGKTQYTKLMNDMFWDTKAFLYDPAQSLFWRDESYKNTDKYWARGNGWVIGGLVRIMEDLPADDSHRADYETLLKEMSTKLRSVQASDGFWRSSLTQPNAYTTPETSGTTFFCFGIAWGINHGILDRATYLPVVTKAWAALGTAVNAQGRLGWVQAVGQAPGPSTADATNDYATGAFLLAGEQVLKL
jgi:rhamnogalacturonyl hydrolase YesR